MRERKKQPIYKVTVLKVWMTIGKNSQDTQKTRQYFILKLCLPVLLTQVFGNPNVKGQSIDVNNKDAYDGNKCKQACGSSKRIQVVQNNGIYLLMLLPSSCLFWHLPTCTITWKSLVNFFLNVPSYFVRHTGSGWYLNVFIAYTVSQHLGAQGDVQTLPGPIFPRAKCFVLTTTILGDTLGWKPVTGPKSRSDQ